MMMKYNCWQEASSVQFNTLENGRKFRKTAVLIAIS